jgi:Na+-driven multidrug efflux pump
MALGFFVKLDGKPLAGVISAVISTAANITLDYIFIVILDMGIKGAALGTGIAQLAATMYLFIEILRSDYWELKKPNFLKSDIFAMIYNGSSEMLSMIAVAITGIIYNLIILKYMGEIGVSAYGIALQIFNFATVLFFGISDAIQSPISYNFGAGALDRVKGLRTISVNTGVFIGVVLGVICFFFGHEISSLFVKDANTIEIAGFIMKFYSIAFVVTGANIVLTTYYTAINQPLLSIILSSSRSLVVVLISVLVLPLVFGEIGIWLPIITTEYVTAIIALVLIKKLPFGIKDNTYLP